MWKAIEVCTVDRLVREPQLDVWARLALSTMPMIAIAPSFFLLPPCPASIPPPQWDEAFLQITGDSAAELSADTIQVRPAPCVAGTEGCTN